MAVKLIRFIDRVIGAPFCLFLGIIRPLSKKKPSDKIRKILIIQLWGIGETILTIPAIKALKGKYNKAAIDILCTSRNKDVYFNYPFIRKLNIIRLNLFSLKWFMLKNWKSYDIVIDMEEYLNISSIISFFTGKYRIGYSHGLRSLAYSKKVKYKSRQHASKTFFDLVKELGIKGYPQKLERLNYTEKDRKMAGSILDGLGLNRSQIVGIAPGVAESSRSRMWPEERFAELIEGICKKKKDVSVILTGSDHEKKLNSSIISRIADKKIRNRVFNLAGKLSLRQLFYLASRCSLFIGNDSGPMHIAAAMGVKTIGLFGPNLPVRFSPLNRKSIALYKKVPCSPCINVHEGKVPECLFPKGTKDYQKCMKKIKVKDVLDYV